MCQFVGGNEENAGGPHIATKHRRHVKNSAIAPDRVSRKKGALHT